MQVKLIARALQKERQAQAPVTAEVLEVQPADNDNDLRHLLCDRDEAELVLWTKYHNQLGKPVGFVEVEYEVLAIIYARQQYNVAVRDSKRDGAFKQSRAALKAIEIKSISRQWFRDFRARHTDLSFGEAGDIDPLRKQFSTLGVRTKHGDSPPPPTAQPT